jgi:hypothetical protein
MLRSLGRITRISALGPGVNCPLLKPNAVARFGPWRTCPNPNPQSSYKPNLNSLRNLCSASPCSSSSRESKVKVLEDKGPSHPPPHLPVLPSSESESRSSSEGRDEDFIPEPEAQSSLDLHAQPSTRLFLSFTCK